jgi:glycosyltransferase involved in cell wall biosynthesis
MVTPLLSVLIPTYRRPALLERALRSVVDQGGEHIEIIVGDDGDVSDGIVASFGSRVRHLRNQPRLGLARNVNHLARNAQGEFLAFLMEDDYWLPRFSSTALSVFREMPDLGVAFTNHFFENGQRRVRECQLAPGRHDDFSVKLLQLNPVPISGAIIRRSLWEDVAPLPETQAFDFVLWARAAEQGWSFFYVDEPLMVYRSSPEGLSASRAFRHEVVVALESLSFENPEARDIHWKRLNKALYLRAKGNMTVGKPHLAVADITRLAARHARRMLKNS